MSELADYLESMSEVEGDTFDMAAKELRRQDARIAELRRALDEMALNAAEYGYPLSEDSKTEIRYRLGILPPGVS